MAYVPVREKIVEKKRLRGDIEMLLQQGNEIIVVTPFEIHEEWLMVVRYLIIYRKRSVGANEKN